MQPAGPIASIANLRDLGGHATGDGGRVRHGLVYRSAELAMVGASDMPALAALGLKKIYDLRPAGERTPHPDVILPGAQDVVLDALADAAGASAAEVLQWLAEPEKANATLGGGRAAALLVESYVELVSLRSARAALGRLFAGLADSGNLPALFHCTTGKHRTGWAAAVLMTLIGVPEDAVMADYLASNDHILPACRAAIDRFTQAGVEPEILHTILGVRREYLNASFSEMHARYGRIEDYFSIALGIDYVAQERLCAQLVATHH
jgi:protein-tyrosine phosphatase